MPRRTSTTLAALVAGSLLPLTAAAAIADPGRTAPEHSGHPARSGSDRDDNGLHPLAIRKNALRQAAVDQLATGDARLRGHGRHRTIETDDGSEVDYPVTQTAQLLTFLVDFSGDGPQAGQIPKPDPSENGIYWRPKFDRKHYLDMFFDGMREQGGQSFKDFYREMSSGRFDVQGDVGDWVRVPHDEATYGVNVNGDDSPENMSNFVADTADAWYAAQLEGKSPQQVKAYLARFDVWDRYDADGDGVYDEPDGYIDHFQAVHAGIGEEAGGPPSSIWSRRSGASWWTDTGPDGSLCGACVHQGGVEIGDSGYYILDYTTEPENGGLGIFAHEFGHDLGLPDYYDTQSDEPDNGTGFWTLMSSGSWMSEAGKAVGTTPDHMGATEKYFLGWYGADDLAQVDGLADEPATVDLGPSNHATSKGKQAVLVSLPDGHRVETGPASGSDDDAYLYSGNRDRAFTATTGPPIDLPAGSPQLSARVAYQIEPGFDYAFLRVSTDDGATWTDIPTSESVDPADPFYPGISGVSGVDVPDGVDFREVTPNWVDLTADLSAYAGQTIRLRWEYLTDQRTHGWGLAVDDLSAGGYSTDFAPADDWTDEGFHKVVDGKYAVTFPQYYLAENRQYRGYDTTLEHGPYSRTDDPDRVEHLPYQDGLLVWYANGYYTDNDTSAHPGGGANLPVDARPANQVWRDADGEPVGLANGRLQAFDATFDVDRTDGFAVAQAGRGSPTVRVRPTSGVPVFEDADPQAYLDDSGGPEGLRLSTAVAGAGTEIQVVSSDERTGRMVLKIGKRFVAVTRAPHVLGQPRAGRALVAWSPDWFQPRVAERVQWLRDGQPIDGATRIVYRVRPGDVGHRLSVRFTGSKSGYRSTTTTSKPTARVEWPRPPRGHGHR